MNLEELSKIPISEIEKYINIIVRKTECIKMQNYEAIILRNEQIIFIDKYPILDIISNDDIISKLRERKINEIINDII